MFASSFSSNSQDLQLPCRQCGRAADIIGVVPWTTKDTIIVRVQCPQCGEQNIIK